MSKQDVNGAKKMYFLGSYAFKNSELNWNIHIFSLEQFEKRERHARERAAAENELEGFAFEVSQLLEEEEYIKHSTEEERNKLNEEVGIVFFSE